jgi:hypothetical protein
MLLQTTSDGTVAGLKLSLLNCQVIMVFVNQIYLYNETFHHLKIRSLKIPQGLLFVDFFVVFGFGGFFCSTRA